MSEAPRKHCLVAYATAERQYLWELELPQGASIADALRQARAVAQLEAVPWDSAPVGIFGELRDRTDIPADGDRIELYRPLDSDPRESRRERVRRLRGTAGRSGR